jgi:hypothetical protein
MKTRHLAAAAAFVFSLGQAALAQSSSDSMTQATSVSRAEVLADITIYRESGLADLNRIDAVDFFSPQYVRAQARYADLRRSPRFAALVHRFEGGGAVSAGK